MNDYNQNNNGAPQNPYNYEKAGQNPAPFQPYGPYQAPQQPQQTKQTKLNIKQERRK